MVAPPFAVRVRLVLSRTPKAPLDVPLIVIAPPAFRTPLALTPYLELPAPFSTIAPPAVAWPVKKTAEKVPLLWPLSVRLPVPLIAPPTEVPPTSPVALGLPRPLTTRLATLRVPGTLTP